MMRVNLIFCLFLSFSASALDLKKAAVCDGMSENKTEIDLNAARIIETVYKQNNIDLSASCLGWTNLGVGGVWFEILSDLKVNGINVSTKQYLGNWPLGASDPCADSDDPHCISPEWAGRWSEQEFLEPEVKKLAVMYPMSISSVGRNVGCLNDKPLSYGDIENDGTKELVITLNDNLIVFNVNKKVVSFMSLISVNDWETAENTKELYAENTSDVDPQYVSLNQISTAVTSKITSLDKDPSMRGYAKHYFGNFSANDANEILVWRKLYRSFLEKDPRKGFDKISDSHAHYKLIDGEYKKQETEQDVIKAWLESKNLTWQKGYPSKSECPGQEGQLIPEMHDPLLNDPDVLK